MRRGLRKLLTVSSVVLLTLLAAVFGGPLVSGGLLLLLPTGLEAVAHDLPTSYAPLHKGFVDPSTGLYVRENEDLVIPGTPALILKRTYLSGYRASKEFGIGTTHNGEIYLHGNLRQASLILETGSRIVFDRTSPGISYVNAMFEHRSSGDWDGARLGWAGFGWALKHPAGDLMTFRGCGSGSVCSITQERDSDGHSIRYVRDFSGRLTRMQTTDRWIDFTYDGKNRVKRARTSTGQAAFYQYDDRGRLTEVETAGRFYRYRYTDRDEMAVMEEPGRTITNTYDANGRCIRQDVRNSGSTETLTFTFSFDVDAGEVVRAAMRRSDGPWSRYVFNRYGSVVSESWGTAGAETARVDYERDAQTDQPRGLTVTCPDRKGLPLRHIGYAGVNGVDYVKSNILSTHCRSTKEPPAGPE